METDEMLPVLEEMDKLGYHSMEVWGGATFDSCIRYLNEDPWERLRKFKQKAKNTPLQMLLRGQNILGYKHYPDDVLEKFVEKSIKNGIDIIRIFDALNDVRNLKRAIEFTNKYGGHAQGTIVYTTSPLHDIEHYIETAKEVERMGADSLCLKDMAGLLAPFEAYNLIKKLKEETKDIKKDIKVAVMGCAVNGPGEARVADIGIAGGKESFLIFKKGKPQ